MIIDYITLKNITLAGYVIAAVYLAVYAPIAFVGAWRMVREVYRDAWHMLYGNKKFTPKEIKQLKIILSLHMTCSTLYGLKYLFADDDRKEQLEDDYLELVNAQFGIDGNI